MSDDDGVMSQWCTVIQQRAGTLIFEEASERPVEGVVSDRTRVTRLEFSILYHTVQSGICLFLETQVRVNQ